MLGGAARHLDATPEAIGGMADHVHLLVGFKATHRLADIVRDLKRSSSLWVHETIHLARIRLAGWLRGVQRQRVGSETVRACINNQAEPHRTRTFREEYIAFLRRTGLEYDEHYLD